MLRTGEGSRSGRLVTSGLLYTSQGAPVEPQGYAFVFYLDALIVVLPGLVLPLLEPSTRSQRTAAYQPAPSLDSR